jgi:hypothetical protein
MRFARVLFLTAGVGGILVVAPLYFLEEHIGRDYAITHPEYFYGFVGIGLAWQIAFLIVAIDPLRYRWIMPAGAAEKLSFGTAMVVLYVQQRIPPVVLVAGVIDLILGALCTFAFWRTKPPAE